MNDRSESRPVSTEPEREVHADEEQKESYADRLSEQIQELASLKDIVRRQTLAIVQLRQSELNPKRGLFEITDIESIIKDGPMPCMDLELDSWSDDDDSITAHNESIHNSIVAIQKEASRVDTVMALDQLDTIKQELGSIKRQLINRSSEVKELRSLIQLKDDRLANLELERDLYKADANKMKADLQNRISTIAKAGMPSASEAQINIPCAPKHQALHEHRPAEPSSVIMTTRSKPDATVIDKSSVDHASAQGPACGHIELTERRPTVLPSLTGSVHSDVSTRDARATAFSFALNQNDPPQLSKAKSVRYSAGSKARAFLPFRCTAGSKKAAARTTTDNFGGSTISLQAHIEELHQRLELSVSTSEELRRRLAMISRYYENLVRRLQESLVETKADKAKMEVDLVNQISAIDIAKRKALAQLETKLRQKEKEIATLQEI